MAELPIGTVTFLFTDIEGSTTRWEHQPEAMSVALARHDGLLRTAIEEHSGVVVKTVGDAFHAAFVRATDAVAAALNAQHRLQAETWDDTGELRVRMALHTGVAEMRDGDYFGPVVNRAARLVNLGHGGQVLLSQTTYELVRDTLSAETRLLDLGEHWLKDLIRPEHIFQVVDPGLPAEMPPLRTQGRRPSNLPFPTTALLDRARELAAARDLLLRDEVRLLTLTGPGGVGKTRLSLQVSAEVVDHFADGVFFVALALISDPGLVGLTIAQTLGIRDSGGRPAVESLREYLQGRQILLVLDNFEQLLPAAQVVAELIGASSKLKVLATSRAPLEIRGERELAVPPLALPDPQRLPPNGGLMHYGAVALFAERASAIRPDFAITKENAPAVAAICHQLDGLPLAIELAAARTRVLSPQAMLNRLDRRLPFLTGGPRHLPVRQQTLRGAIAWSYDLLDLRDQVLFRRLAIFVGGCTLEAAEAVCNPEDDLGLDVLDGIASLVAKSLLHQVEGPEGESRFWMLETIREFGQDQLEGSGEVALIRERHAAFFLDLTERAEPKLYEEAQVDWLRKLVAEHANLRTVLSWCQQQLIAPDVGLQIVGALSQFWILQGFVQEGLDSTDALLILPDAARRTATRASALYTHALLAEWQANFEVMRSSARESAAIYREIGDLRGTGRAVSLWAIGERVLSSAAEGRVLLEQGAAIARDIDDRWGLAYALGQLGMAAQRAGNLTTSRALRAESAALAREVGERHVLGLAVTGLAALDLMEGNLGSATTWFKEALTRSMEIEDAVILPRSLAGLASIAVRQGDRQRATRLFARAQAQRDASGARETRPWREIFDPDIAHLRADLGDAVFDAAWTEGRSMTLEQAAAYGMEASASRR